MSAEFQTETSASDWFADRYQAIYVSRNRWFVTAWMALGLALLQGGALLGLLPLKTSIPFLIKEETSGAVTTLTPLSGDPSVTYDEAVRKYFLARYILARETYDPMDLAENYNAVEIMSGSEERRLFKEAIASSNPLSPIVLYGNQGRRFIRVSSIVFLNAATAQIRFTATGQRSATLLKPSNWIATVAFKFGAFPSSEAERLINPLGFTVTHYRIDQDVVP